MMIPHNLPEAPSAVKQAVVALAPAVGAGFASLANLVETGVSIVLLLTSLAFLIWRWRVAWKDRQNGD